MTECNSHETPNIYPNLNAIPLNVIPLNNQQQFRLNKINEIKDYFVAEIKERELMSKRLSKYIASFDYFDKSLIVLSVTTGSISIASFATVIGAPLGIASASFSLAFSISIEISKKLFVILAGSRSNSTESKVSKALINNEISHEDFMTIILEERNYRELKEIIRIMNSQRSDTEKINLIEDGKEIGIDEIIKRNEIINKILNSKR